eukprot:TRINITY_DN4556_c0_g1_i4.p1 TRINITY_DN4556_c0_g1~~TRINITY_DN4556_c0_g1_i4.p1  ORF type:complete len:186 (+),score=55.97 TRINITY_DN4556_c0_g1_i4:127-684(+)
MNNDVYKEFQNQNFLEIRFSNRKTAEISRTEALTRYKRNNAILGRIFSQPMEEEPKDVTNGKMEEDLDRTLEHLEREIDRFQRDLEGMRTHQGEKLTTFRARNKVFTELMNEAKHLKNEEQTKAFLEKLKEIEFYAAEHPFFNEKTPYFLSLDDAPIKRVDTTRVSRQSVLPYDEKELLQTLTLS